MRWLMAVLLVGLAGGIPLQQGWYRGRRFSYYEFSSGSDVKVIPRMYTFATQGADGKVAAVAGLSNVIDTPQENASYTGLWDHVYVVVDQPPATPVTSAADILAGVANSWQLLPSGLFTHCPLVQLTTVLDGQATQPTKVWYDDQPYYCFALGTSRHYPSTGFIDVWDIKKLPTRAQVAGNTLLDWSPTEHGFVPAFRKRVVYVAATYVDNSVTSVASLMLEPHQLGDTSEDTYVTWYITSLAPPAWDTQQWLWHRDLGTTQFWWTLEQETLVMKVQAQFGVGCVGVGFGLQGYSDNEATMNLIAYIDENRNLCTTYAYVEEGSTSLTVIADNLMGVTDVSMDVTWQGVMTLVFTRRLESTVIDSLGYTRPSSTIVNGKVSRLVWASQSGPPISSCNVPLSKLVSPIYATKWSVEEVQWTASNTAVPVPPVTYKPIPFSPSPVLTGTTPSPLAVAADKVHGTVVFDSRLSLGWEMTVPGTMLFSLQYKGNLSAERKWMGIGFGNAFQYSDIITVWFTKGGQPLVQDRKAVGLKLPPLDARQDVYLVASSISSDLTVVNFSRKLSTGDVGTSVQQLPRATLTRTVLTRYNGWYAGRRTEYYSVATPGGVFGGAQPFAAPLYRIQFQGSTDLIPGQLPLIGSLPGQDGYSDLRQIIIVNPPADYDGPVITWVHSIPNDWSKIYTSVFMNCPVVHPATTLEYPEDTANFPKTQLWYDGEIAYCIDFAVRATSLPTLYPLAWAPASDSLNGTLVNKSTSDMTYTGVWNLYTWNSTQGTEEVTDATVLPPALADAKLQGYVNRPIASVQNNTLPATPSPELMASYDNTMYLSSEPGNEVVLKWTIDTAADTMKVQVVSDITAMVGIGFSATTYSRMAHADMVVGYFSPTGGSCIRVLYSVNEVGVPTGFPQLVITDQKLTLLSGKLYLSFTRKLGTDASTEGIIPENPYQSMRVLYATAANAVGSCTGPDISFLSHGTYPHGSRVIYWRLPDGTPSVIPSAAPSTGLPLPLDIPVTYTREVSWFAGSSVTHYIIGNSLTGNSTYVEPMYVYDVWWPSSRNAIIDAVPGITGYSDLMKVRRVRLPDGFPDQVTSLDQLRTSNAFIEDTDYYWNCPVISSKATFDPQDTITIKKLWYSGQEVQCAYFGNLTSTRVTPLYEVWVNGAFTGNRVLTSTPSSIGYSAFNWVMKVTVADADRNTRSAAELLSKSISVTDASPTKLLNIPIMQIDPGTPLQLVPITLPLNNGWLDNRQVHYADFSALYGKIPTLQDNIVTADVFAFRSQSDYWSPKEQDNVVAVVPGQTAYADLWKVTLVVVPSGTAQTITQAADIPDEWKVETQVVINCPIVHKDTTFQAYPDGSTPQLPKESWWWNNTRVTCFLLEETVTHTGAVLEQLTSDVLITASALPVFTAWPGNDGGGLVVPKNFAGLNGVVYTSAAMVAGLTLSASPWAVNWPIISIEALQQPRSAAYDMQASEGLYRGKVVAYWPVVNDTLPPVYAMLSQPEPDAIQETLSMVTSEVYIFRQGGNVVESMLPVFDYRPGQEYTVDGKRKGYSHLKRVFFVDMPSSAPVSSIRSVQEVANQGWQVTEAQGVYYNWPLCGESSTVPQGISLLTGWSSGVYVYYFRLSEQKNAKVSKAFKVRSGKLVFPLVPEEGDYSAFHTIWEVDAPDSFDPTADLALYTPTPVYPVRIMNLPILAAPSASSQSNEVDTQKVYDKKAAWMNGRVVHYYSFFNTPVQTGTTVTPMDVYALRDGTAYTSGQVQASEIATRSAGQAGYSDLHAINVVEVTGTAQLPLRSTDTMFAEALNNTWTIVPSGLLRVAPAVHPASLLSDEAHRLLYPKRVVYQGGRETVVMDFGFSDTATVQLPIYKVVNTNGLVSYILSSATVPSARICMQIVKFATTTEYPLTALDSSWTECQTQTEATCPREHCTWNGTCIQPETKFVCAQVSQSQGSAPLVTLSRQTGWFQGRKLTYYESPNVVPGNVTQAFTDLVYVFRYAAQQGQDPYDADEVPGLVPVFNTLPGSATYSDMHRVVVVTVPKSYAGGLLDTQQDVLDVVEGEGWTMTDTGTIANWWVVNDGSSLEERDAAAVPKRSAWADGEGVAYFDFGFVNSLDHSEKFVLVRNGLDVMGNDIFIAAELIDKTSSTPYSPLVWEVAITVGSSYVANNYTSAQQLSRFVPDYAVRQKIANNPIITLDAPVSPLEFDDLIIDPSQVQEVSWAYSGIHDVTQMLEACTQANRGMAKVSLLASDVTLSPDISGPSDADIRMCLVIDPMFTMCWEILAVTPDEITVTFKVQTGNWVGIALSYEMTEAVRYADVWMASNEVSGPRVIDSWIGATHTGKPLSDAVLGGTNNLVRVDARSHSSAIRDYYNMTFTRVLQSSDTTTDVNINSSRLHIYWARGPGSYEMHEHTGSFCLNFFSGVVEFDCMPSSSSQWWIPFTVILLSWLVLCALFLKTYSKKNAVLHTTVAFRGSVDRHLTAVQLVLVAVYIALMALWIGMSEDKYRNLKRKVPGLRAFGSGAVLCFSLLLLPVTRSSPLLWAFGISKYRAIRWHKWNGMLLLLLVFIHGVGMVATYSLDAIGWKKGDVQRQPGLAGFLAFLGMLVQGFVATSPFGGRAGWFKRHHYIAFRIIHLLGALWTLVCAVLHHPPLLYGVLFSLILFAIDKLCYLYQWMMAVDGWSTILSCLTCFVWRKDGMGRSGTFSYEDDTFADGRKVSCIELKVQSSDHAICYDTFRIDSINPLQYVLLSMPAAGGGWHPVALSNRPVHVEDDQHEPFKGFPTTTFTVHIGTNEVRRNTWSARVHQLCGMKQLGPVRVMGPYGRPAIDFRAYEHLILIGGGIGAAPLMSIIEHYLDPVWGKQRPVGRSRTKLITLVWAAKDRRMFDLFCGSTPPGALRMALDIDNEVPTSNKNFAFRMFLHETSRGRENPLHPDTGEYSPDGIEQLQQLADMKAAAQNCARVQLVYRGRPNLFQSDGTGTHPNIFDSIVAQNELSNPALPGLTSRISAAGVVACGPKSMMRAVRASVDKHNTMRRGLTFHLHSEIWET